MLVVVLFVLAFITGAFAAVINNTRLAGAAAAMLAFALLIPHVD